MQKALFGAAVLAAVGGPGARSADTLTIVEQAATLSDPSATWVAQHAAASAGVLRGNNTSIIMQNGNNNQASTDQTNSGNTALIQQTGNSNSSILAQYGSNGLINNTQIGTGIGINVTQTGNAPAITITQTRPGR